MLRDVNHIIVALSGSISIVKNFLLIFRNEKLKNSRIWWLKKFILKLKNKMGYNEPSLLILSQILLISIEVNKVKNRIKAFLILNFNIWRYNIKINKWKFL